MEDAVNSKQCSWRDDDGIWKSECGLSWTITNNDGLLKNEMSFCPKCGLKILEIFPKQDIEEDINDNEKCCSCNEKGGIYRDKDGWFIPCECNCCGKIGSQLVADKLNLSEENNNKGFHFDRVEFNAYEQAFYEEWADQNRPRHGINGSLSIVQSVISKTVHKDAGLGFRFKPIPKSEVATERDYKVAASVIQFLGSNGGQYFLSKVEERFTKILENSKSDDHKRALNFRNAKNVITKNTITKNDSLLTAIKNVAKFWPPREGSIKYHEACTALLHVANIYTITVINTDTDLANAIARLDVIIDAPDGSPEANERTVLSDLIATYEDSIKL